jgi:D-alanine-D-alanine ligase
MNSLGKVAVIYGGISAEREVSLRSGAGVIAALQSLGVQAHGFDPAMRPLHDLKAMGIDRAFIALHGRYGEDGCLQGALEWMEIPYTGSGVMASALAMDKTMTKRVWLNQGLTTPGFESLGRLQSQDKAQLDLAVGRLGFPMIVKPPHEGSTIGVSKVHSLTELKNACELALRFDEEVLLEQFIDGAELTITVLGRGADARALPIVEIRAPQGNYDFENKYNTDVVRYLCPAPLSAAQTAAVQQLAVKAYRAVGCEGWARVDVMLRHSDAVPFLLEVNTSPGMTDHSLSPMAAKAQGLSYAQFCLDVLQTASLKVRRVNRAGEVGL